MNLTQWQEQLVEHLKSQRTDDFQRQWVFNGNTPGLDVYRNNCEQALIATLMTTYPLCLTTLGEAYFRKICARYISEYPCGYNGLNDYGELFNLLIESLIEKEYLSVDFSYLPDLIKLEWLIQKAYYAKSSRIFDMDYFSSLTQEQQACVVFELSDECHYLSSKFPLFEIWQRHHLGVDSVVIEQSVEQYYSCVHRDGYKTVVSRLTEKEFAVLSAIDKSTTMTDLCSLSTDLSCIALFIHKGWIDNFTVPATDDV